MKNRGKTVKRKKAKIRVARKRKIAKIVRRSKVKTARRVIRKALTKKPVAIGKVFAYYPNISVAAIKLNDKLRLGDRILIKGEKTNFEQRVESMQIEHKSVDEAKKGSDVGIKIIDIARQNDIVYRV